jgi:hypothetical protein
VLTEQLNIRAASVGFTAGAKFSEFITYWTAYQSEARSYCRFRHSLGVAAGPTSVLWQLCEARPARFVIIAGVLNL